MCFGHVAWGHKLETSKYLAVGGMIKVQNGKLHYPHCFFRFMLCSNNNNNLYKCLLLIMLQNESLCVSFKTYQLQRSHGMIHIDVLLFLSNNVMPKY